MKTTITKRISAVTLTVLLVLGSVTFVKSEEAATEKETTQIVKNKGGERCFVTENEIISYLESYDYSNVKIISAPSPCQRIVDTDYSYNTIVYLSGNSIVGHDDTE